MTRQRFNARSASPDAFAPTTGSEVLVRTFVVRHVRGLDVVFLLDPSTSDFQIGMGAASEDYAALLLVGVDRRGSDVRATAAHTVRGRNRAVPARIVYRSPTTLVVEATPLPLQERPASLKCWSFSRQGDRERFSDVTGFVSPALVGLPHVPIKTHPCVPSGQHGG